MRRWTAVALAGTLLVLCAGAAWAQAQDEAKAAVTKVIEDMVAAVNAGDAQAFGALCHEGMVSVVPGPMGADVYDLQALLGPMGIENKPAEPLAVNIEDVFIQSGMAFARATLTQAGQKMTGLGAVALVQGAWKLVFTAIIPPATADEAPGIQAAVRPIWEDIEAEGQTGMQAALNYLGDTPAVFALGLDNQVMVLSGRDAIQQTVSGWPPPADVALVGERTEILGSTVAAEIFDSAITNQGQRRTLHNMVVLAQVGGQWKVVGFIVSFKPLPAQPAAPGPAAPEPPAAPEAPAAPAAQ